MYAAEFTYKTKCLNYLSPEAPEFYLVHSFNAGVIMPSRVLSAMSENIFERQNLGEGVTTGIF